MPIKRKNLKKNVPYNQREKETQRERETLRRNIIYHFENFLNFQDMGPQRQNLLPLGKQRIP
jgi:hypothetical protein